MLPTDGLADLPQTDAKPRRRRGAPAVAVVEPAAATGDITPPPAKPRRKAGAAKAAPAKAAVRLAPLPPPAPVASPARAAPAGHGALELYAQVLGAGSLAAAAHRLVATLAADLGYDRVCLGLHDQGRTRLLAGNQGDLGQAQAELTQRLLGAMDEAIDQSVPLAWPRVDDAGQPPVSEHITFEQRSLQSLWGGALACVPLGQGGEVFGALCLQRDHGPALQPGELQALEQLLGLATPALRWMGLAQLPWHRRTQRDLLLAWARWRQPERRSGRRLAALAALVLGGLALAPLQHEVGGRARIEGAEQRLLVAPVDGFIKTAFVRPGDRVAAGAPLLDMLEQDLRLERERWGSQLAQHENAHAAAMARADRVAAATSMARVAEAQSQLALVDGQLSRGRLVAPFDGLVVQGDFSQSIGAPVRQGDSLITLASTGQYRVIVEVDESDIARVAPGQGGSLSLSSLPWGGQDLVVERIAPLARAVDGRNVFEVEARLADPDPTLRPGLLGRARLVVGRMPPLWVWLQQAANRIRLSYWSWLG